MKKLYVQVLIGMALGVLLGAFAPTLGPQMKPIGDAFIGLIRAIVPVLVFSTVTVGIAKMGDLRQVGRVGIRALVFFEVVTTIALVIGVVVCDVVKPGAGMHVDPATLDPKAVAGYVQSAKSLTIVEFLLKLVPTNLVADLARGDILPVLVMALLFGFALCQMGERARRLIDLIDDLTHAIFAVVRIIMYAAPLAAFAAMAFTIGKLGFGATFNLVKVVATVYLTSILFVVLGFGTIARLFGLRLWKILGYFKEELLITFSATSGEAMIPRALAKLEAMGCARDVAALVLPAGFSFNTVGTALYMTTGLLFIAQAMDIPLDLRQQLTVLFVMLFTSKGAAGVAGAGFVALAASLPALDVVPAAGLVLLFTVDRFMSEIRAVTNLFSNIFATVVVAKWIGAYDAERARAVLDERKRPREPIQVAAAGPRRSAPLGKSATEKGRVEASS